ncbi:MAG: heparinase II/III family protein [Desulfobacterales bacterium]|nr:heparinase II/III family protein [Desulfobacterales bacterium]
MKILLVLVVVFCGLFPEAANADNHMTVDERLVGDNYRLQHPRLPHPEFPELLEKHYNIHRKKQYKDVRELLLVYLATKEPALLVKIKQLVNADLPGSVFNKINELSLAYDWAYNDLDNETRKQFLERITRYTKFAVEYYKKHRISPYNDVGYVRIGYSFVVGAIVSYPDHPDSENLIRFAKKVLLDIYLPVWKQIMGDGGGWHEGIEYLHVGVGRVVAPALHAWGYATGNDLFQQNKWLEELIYYPIYTTRPDMTPLRLGDINDASLSRFKGMCALAAIYANPYGIWWLTNGKGFDEKSNWTDCVWPWYEKVSPVPIMADVSNLPLHRHFKGIGLVTMRGGWSEDDVYGTFKVGDNYWSHQHFDSGTFTLYRRGALAIDSGSYTAGYSSDHHMKYQMQTIAHNCITVTDPLDVDTSSKWKLPNDGGQRRVGSGGYNNSPDHLAAWMKSVDDYEMGDIVTISMNKTYVHVLGDVTSAYTNSKTGSGDYRARTPRVEKWLRNFLYIRPEIFIVFDRVSSFKATYKKKWLLHSINEPLVADAKITIDRLEQVENGRNWHGSLKHASGKKRKLYQYNGRLFLYPLLPEKHVVEKVGGYGKEFIVDGFNFNTGRKGVISTDPTKGPQEPGAWRIEISPKDSRKYDTFFNILIPLNADDKNDYKVELNSVILGDIASTHISKNDQHFYVSFKSTIENKEDPEQIRYKLHSENSNGEHYLFGFSPGTCYSLSHDSKQNQTVFLNKTSMQKGVLVICADKNGAIFFTTDATK